MQNPLKQKSRSHLSIFTGNTIQLLGLVLGFTLACISEGTWRIPVISMLAGYVLVYFSSHSISHYLIGRLVGIKFTDYSIGGSSHAAAYPSPMRWIFERLPFFSVHSEASSMKSASGGAKAAMFLAGVTGTVLFSTLATLCAYNAHIRGALILVGFNIFWQIGTIITEFRPGGDIAKARMALRSRAQ
jgi:hypothetical protein